MKIKFITYYDLLAKDLLNEWTVNAGEEKKENIIEISASQLNEWFRDYDGITQDKLYDYIDENYHDLIYKNDDKVINDLYYLVSGTNFIILD